MAVVTWITKANKRESKKMNARKTFITCAAGLAVASPIALAGPGEKDAKFHRAFRGLPDQGVPANPEQANFIENFDSYANGSNIIGQGGWEAWYTGGGDALVDNTRSTSPSNALKLLQGPATDVVQRLAITSGVWEFSIQIYVPSTTTPGDGGMVIMLNQYGGSDNWSMQMAINEAYWGGSQPEFFMIESQWDGALLPLKLDQWVEFKAVIDLDNDVWNSWYGGDPLGVDLNWSTGGTPAIAALDLWTSSTLDPPNIWFDDISLTGSGGCPCACNVDTSTGPGVCDVFDFLGFQNGFVGADPCACDIDTSTGPGVCDVFDFLAFQDEFVSGCP